MTITELETELAKYILARDRILEAGQKADAQGYSVEQGNLQTIENKIRDLRSQIVLLQKGTLTHSFAVFGGIR